MGQHDRPPPPHQPSLLARGPSLPEVEEAVPHASLSVLWVSVVEQLQSDEETRRELRHLAHFVETCLRSPEVLSHEASVKSEAKTRFSDVRERLLRE